VANDAYDTHMYILSVKNVLVDVSSIHESKIYVCVLISLNMVCGLALLYILYQTLPLRCR